MDKNLEKILKDKKCYIFDLDGTVADTERYQWIAHNAVLKKHFGIEVDMEHIFKYLGKPEEVFLKEIEKDYNIDIAGPKGKGYEKYSKERSKTALKMILKEVKPFEYTKDVLFGSLGVRIALVTAQNKTVIRKMLAAFNLAGLFPEQNMYVVDENTTKPMYYDQIFKTLRNAKPEDVVLFEDVNKYIKEGKARGFKTVGIKNGFGNEELEADLVIDVKNYQ